MCREVDAFSSLPAFKSFKSLQSLFRFSSSSDAFISYAK